MVQEVSEAQKQLSRACLVCTNLPDGERTSLLLVAVPGLHVAHILRGVPRCNLPPFADPDPDREESDEVMVVNVEEAEFLVARLSEWIDAHHAYNAAHPDATRRKSYTAEVRED